MANLATNTALLNQILTKVQSLPNAGEGGGTVPTPSDGITVTIANKNTWTHNGKTYGEEIISTDHLINGEYYLIVFDGVKYVRRAKTGSDYEERPVVYLGNLAINTDISEDETGEPFLLYNESDNNSDVYVEATVGTHTIDVSLVDAKI